MPPTGKQKPIKGKSVDRVKKDLIKKFKKTPVFKKRDAIDFFLSSPFPNFKMKPLKKNNFGDKIRRARRTKGTRT